MSFLVLIKFIGKIPINDELKDVFEYEPKIQTAFVLSGGDYHLMLSMYAESEADINEIRRKLMRDTVLFNYPAEWYITPFYDTYGFIPLRSEFIETFKERMKQKESELFNRSTEKRQQVMSREFTVLKELNDNGNIDFSEIDKKYGFDKGRSQYAYYKLLQKGILKRITINMKNSGARYVVLLFLKVTNYKKFNKSKKSLAKSVIKNTNFQVNKYTLIGDIWVPFTSIFLFPIFEEDIDKITKELSNINGTEIKTSALTKILLGSLCYRRFDNAYSIQQKNLEELEGKSKIEKVDYFPIKYY